MTIKTLSTPTPNGKMLESFQDIKDRVPVSIDQTVCTGCELCVYACPQAVLQVKPNVHRVEGLVAFVHNPALCTACRQCEDVCPDFCITVSDFGSFDYAQDKL